MTEMKHLLKKVIRNIIQGRNKTSFSPLHTIFLNCTINKMDYYHERIVGIVQKKNSSPILKIYNLCLIGILSLHFGTLLFDNDNKSPTIEPQKRKLIENIPSRAFQAWNRTEIPFPCVHPLQSKETEGIFYIKVPKTASSTLAHITERIAHRESKRQGLFGKDGFNGCKTYLPMVHQKAVELNLMGRDKLKSFTYSFVRNPADRLLSHFAMNVLQGMYFILCLWCMQTFLPLL